VDEWEKIMQEKEFRERIVQETVQLRIQIEALKKCIARVGWIFLGLIAIAVIIIIFR